MRRGLQEEGRQASVLLVTKTPFAKENLWARPESCIREGGMWVGPPHVLITAELLTFAFLSVIQGIPGKKGPQTPKHSKFWGETHELSFVDLGWW